MLCLNQSRAVWGVLSALVLGAVAEVSLAEVWQGSVCNPRRNKTLTSVCFEVEGGRNTTVDSITDTNDTPIPGATIKQLAAGKYEVCIPVSLAFRECLNFRMHGANLSGSGIRTTKKVYVPADPPTSSFTEMGDLLSNGFTAWVDVFSLGGGPTGESYLGVAIPPGTFVYFVQFNNLPGSLTPIKSFELDQSQAAGPPLEMGELPLPHNQERACCGAPGYPAIPTAAFEMLGPVPAVAASGFFYDPGSNAIFIDYSGTGGIGPGMSSNVFYYISADPPSIESNVELSPTVVAESGVAPAAVSRALGPRNRNGDIDGDGDVDLVDFGRFQLCYSGSGNLAGMNCDLADLDGDGDVDLLDFSIFQLNYTGSL